MQCDIDRNPWVEPSGDIIVARLRGEPSEETIRATHERILGLAKETGRWLVLYDALEMTPPPVDVPLVQQQLDQDLGATRLKRAIVVPTTKLAYLARLAFGDGDYRVFYNDLAGAATWLREAADQPH